MLRRFRHILARQRQSAGDSFEADRRRMVQEDLVARGISCERVIGAMARVPRERFVSETSLNHAYSDRALQIDCDQTISQPYIVALMTELLDVQADHHVLEVGTGSGYQAAVLAELAHDVVTIERHAALSQAAQQTLADLDYQNITFIIGDGSLGWPQLAPYNRIIVTAAAAAAPPALLEQLADGGQLVAPIGSRHDQQLQVCRRIGERFERAEVAGCRFVPLVGEQGFSAEA